MPYLNLPNYSIDSPVPQVAPTQIGMNIPLPIGGINVSVPSFNIADNEASEAFNKWTNKEGRIATFPGNTAFSGVLEASSKIINEFKFEKTINSTFNMVAWDNGVNLKLGYVDGNGDLTVIDSTMTTGSSIDFDVYLNREGVLLDSGTATSGGDNTLTDSGGGWEINEFKGKILVLLTGTGTPAAGIITGNSATEITVKQNWVVNPDATTTYEIRELSFSLYYTNKNNGLRSWNGLAETSIGDSTSQFDITNPSGDTYRYTWDSTGTDPDIDANIKEGQEVVTNAENFDSNNNGTFIVTTVSANYFEITNTSGVVESDKTIGTGSIIVKPFLAHLDVPKGDIIKIFKDYAFIAGGEINPSAVYASQPYDVVNFFGNNWEILGSETVDSVTGIGIYRGKMIIFKNRANIPVTLSVDTSGNLIWQQGEIDFTRGCVNKNSLVEIDSDLMVWDSQGAYMYGYANDITVLGVQERMTDKIQPLFSGLDFSNTRLLYDDIHDVIYVPAKESSTEYNDVVYMFDWKRRNLVNAWWKLGMNVESMIKIGDTIYFGDGSDTTIYTIDEDKFLSDSYVTSKDFNFGSDFLKQADFMKFAAKNLSGTIGFQIICALNNESVIALDKQIATGYTGTLSGCMGVAPMGATNMAGGVATSTISLAFLKKVAVIPYYQASYIKVKWYNEGETNSELDSYSLHAELLSKEHDSFSTFI